MTDYADHRKYPIAKVDEGGPKSGKSNSLSSQDTSREKGTENPKKLKCFSQTLMQPARARQESPELSRVESPDRKICSQSGKAKTSNRVSCKYFGFSDTFFFSLFYRILPCEQNCLGWIFRSSFTSLLPVTWQGPNQIMVDVDEHQKITLVSGETMKNTTTKQVEVEAGGGATSAPSVCQYQTYQIRWLILFLFVMYSTSNAFQWTQLVIITNILENYYQVPTLAVSWTSMIYMVTYIPLIFPASWFLQKKVRHLSLSYKPL